MTIASTLTHIRSLSTRTPSQSKITSSTGLRVMGGSLAAVRIPQVPGSLAGPVPAAGQEGPAPGRRVDSWHPVSDMRRMAVLRSEACVLTRPHLAAAPHRWSVRRPGGLLCTAPADHCRRKQTGTPQLTHRQKHGLCTPPPWRVLFPDFYVLVGGIRHAGHIPPNTGLEASSGRPGPRAARRQRVRADSHLEHSPTHPRRQNMGGDHPSRQSAARPEDPHACPRTHRERPAPPEDGARGVPYRVLCPG